MSVDLSGLTGEDRLYFQAVKNSPFKLEPGDWQSEADRIEVSGNMDEDFEPASDDLLPMKRSGKSIAFLGKFIDIWLNASYTRSFRTSREKAQKVNTQSIAIFFCGFHMSVYHTS